MTYASPHNKIASAKVAPFEFAENGQVMSWKVSPVSASGKTPSKTARQNFRRKFGQTVFNSEAAALSAIAKAGA